MLEPFSRAFAESVESIVLTGLRIVAPVILTSVHSTGVYSVVPNNVVITNEKRISVKRRLQTADRG